MLHFNRNKFAKKSYSQCGEDLIVKHIFDCLNTTNPSYLDVGAHHPFYLSNTALFYENGSTGINIEPDPVLFAAFPKHRKRDKNLNMGISDAPGNLDFYIMSTPTLNTFSKEEAEKYKAEGNFKVEKITKIDVNSVSNVIRDSGNGKFPSFPSLDAEGVDELIIKAINYNDNFPVVICIETISFSASGNGVKNHSLIDYISGQGYLAYADTNINTIFVRKSIWEKQQH